MVTILDLHRFAVLCVDALLIDAAAGNAFFCGGDPIVPVFGFHRKTFLGLFSREFIKAESTSEDPSVELDSDFKENIPGNRMFSEAPESPELTEGGMVG